MLGIPIALIETGDPKFRCNDHGRDEKPALSIFDPAWEWAHGPRPLGGTGMVRVA